MPRRPTIGEARWRDAPEFVALAETWRPDAVALLLGFVWSAYDSLCEEVLSRVNCAQDDRDLERSITQYLAPRIQRIMPGESPFDVLHGPYEFETAKKQPAQPPMHDLAFVLRDNERIMLPLEAKTLKSDRHVDAYAAEIRDNFLTCRYAPFSREGGMLGYLVSGEPVRAFESIATQVRCKLERHPAFPERNHRISSHVRSVPADEPYPQRFGCHHMILCLFN